MNKNCAFEALFGRVRLSTGSPDKVGDLFIVGRLANFSKQRPVAILVLPFAELG